MVANQPGTNDNLRDVDRGILTLLESERANAPLLAEELDYSKQYIRERLSILKKNNRVRALGHGLYESTGGTQGDSDNA